MLGIFGVAIQKTIFLSIWIKKCGLPGSYPSVKTILYFRVRRGDSIFRVESFAPDPNPTHSGPYFQRRGVPHTIRDALSPFDHIENARGLVFPSAQSAALPEDVGDAVGFISAENRDSVRSVWRDALLKSWPRLIRAD